MLVHRAATHRAGTERSAGAKVDQLAALFGVFVVAEIEFELPVFLVFAVGQGHLGHKRPAGFGAETVQGADAFVAHKGLGLGHFKGAAGGRLGERETTALAGAIGAGAGVAAVVFFHHTAAIRAGRLQRGVVAGHRVAVVFLGLFHQALGHGGDLGHEGVAAELAALHLREFVFPLAGQLGLGEFLHPQTAQQGHELKGLGGGDQLAAFAQHVLFVQQAFDDGRAGGRGAQAFFLHGLAQLVVVDEFAGAFHGTEQRRFRIARGRLGAQALGLDRFGAHGFALAHRHQVLAFVAVLGAFHVFGRFFAVDRHPARLDQHLAFGLEVMAEHGGYAGGHHELGAWEKHRDEAAHHQVVEFLFGVRQAAGRLQRRDDGKVVADLAVVEDALARTDVALIERGQRVGRQVAHAAVGEHLKGLLDGGQVVLGQGARIGSRIGQRLVPFVQALRQLQRGLGRKTKTAVGLALQAGQVIQQAAGLGGGFALFAHAGGFAAHRFHNRQGLALVPHAVGAGVGVGVFARGFFEVGVEPLGRVFTGLGQKRRVDFPVVARLVGADFFLPLHHHRQRRCLHPAHRGQEEATVARIEGGHGPGAVDAHQPVGLGAAARRIGQGAHLGVAAQLLKPIADGRRCHGLQPQALHRFAQRLAATGVLLDQAKDQLTLAARVAGVDQGAHVFALGEFDHRVQARFGFVDRLQIKEGRQHRQVGKAPFAALHIELLGRGDFHQMAHGRGDHIALVLKVIVVFLELAHHRCQSTHDVLGHRGLLGNDQCFVGTAVFHLYNPLVSRVRTHGGAGAHPRAPACIHLTKIPPP